MSGYSANVGRSKNNSSSKAACFNKHTGDSGHELDERCGVGNETTRAFC